MWNINTSEEELYELPPRAAQLLVNFLNISDGSLTHTNDARKFYEFIRHCHARRVKLTDDAFKELLMRVGCSERQSKYLANIYEHGRNLLKVPCPHWYGVS